MGANTVFHEVYTQAYKLLDILKPSFPTILRYVLVLRAMAMKLRRALSCVKIWWFKKSISPSSRVLTWLLPFIFLSVSLSGQTKMRNVPLPTDGDAILYYVDYAPASIDPGKAGNAQRWNFMTLLSPFIRRSTYLNSQSSELQSVFKESGLYRKIDEDTEAFYIQEDGDLLLAGYAGMDPFGIGVRSIYKYDAPLVEQRQNLQYGDGSNTKTSLSTTFTLNDLPLRIRQLLPVTPDSIRLIMTSQRIDEVDAWGTMLMPGGFFDVLREKRSEARNLRIETKIGSLPWQDITNTLPENDIFGSHVFLSYYFYSSEFNEPIVQVFMKADNKGVDKVIYRANIIEQGIQDVGAIRSGVYVFPNPAIVNARFEFTNLPSDRYRLSIKNVLSEEIWAQEYYIRGHDLQKVDVSFLAKGTYLYSLTNSKGKILSTKRLVIIRP